MASNAQRPKEKVQTFSDWSAKQNRPWLTNTELIELLEYSLTKPDTNNATRIHDISNVNSNSYNSEKYKHLDAYNSGIQNLKWNNEEYITYQLNSHLIKSLSAQLDLTKKQCERSYRWFMEIDLQTCGVKAELVAFCVCALSVHRDDTNRTYHYNQRKEHQDSLFSDIAESIDLCESEIQRQYAKLEQQSYRDRIRDRNYRSFENRWQDRGGI